MSYTDVANEQQVARINKASLVTQEALLALHAQSLAVRARLMTRRAHMTRTLRKFEGATRSEHVGKFREAIDANAKLLQSLQARIARLSGRMAKLQSHRSALMRARASKK